VSLPCLALYKFCQGSPVTKSANRGRLSQLYPRGTFLRLRSQMTHHHLDDWPPKGFARFLNPAGPGPI
jgi:hypothetical protein